MKNLYWQILKVSRGSKLGRELVDFVGLIYYKVFRAGKVFEFNGEFYEYFYSGYNRTIASERVVEIAVAKKLLEKFEGKKILEVGNVMSHYFDIDHMVLDKYEVGENVVNEDVCDYDFGETFDLILSFSTLEHVGHSYGEKKNLAKFDSAIQNLKKYLSDDGVLFVTLPVNFNDHIDKLLKNKKMPFTNKYFMKRTSYLNEWVQTDWEDAINSPRYDGYYANANALFLGEYIKSND